MFPSLVGDDGKIVVCYTMILTKAVPLLRRGPVLLGQAAHGDGKPRMMSITRVQGSDPTDADIRETVTGRWPSCATPAPRRSPRPTSRRKGR